MTSKLSCRLIILGLLIAASYTQMRPNHVEAGRVTRSSTCDELKEVCNGDFTCSDGEAVCATTEEKSPYFYVRCFALGGIPAEHPLGRACDFY
jgi:hypothetical protein